MPKDGRLLFPLPIMRHDLQNIIAGLKELHRVASMDLGVIQPFDHIDAEQRETLAELIGKLEEAERWENISDNFLTMGTDSDARRPPE